MTESVGLAHIQSFGIGMTAAGGLTFGLHPVYIILAGSVIAFAGMVTEGTRLRRNTDK